jgi:hypothetical protein
VHGRHHLPLPVMGTLLGRAAALPRALLLCSISVLSLLEAYVMGPIPTPSASQAAGHEADGAKVAGEIPAAGASQPGVGSKSAARLEGSGSYSTMAVGLPERQRRLRRIVIGTVSACALILVAAGISRVGHASSDAGYGSAVASAPLALSAAPALETPAPAAATDGVGSSAVPAPTKGTLHLESYVKPHSVFLDGKRLGSRSEVVTCGAHQIKVGRGKAHAIDVPCGGELRVGR